MHLLITDDEHAQLLVNGHARTAAKDFDPVPVVKLFTPDAHATSLLAALDPSDGGHSLGTLQRWYRQARTGHDALSDLASIVGPCDRPILRDRSFRPAPPLSEYAHQARLSGSILD